METIIYFQKQRGLTRPVVEPIGMKTYLLVRVSMDVASDAWFGVKVQKPEAPGRAAMETRESLPQINNRVMAIFHPIRAGRYRRQELLRKREECERRYECIRCYHVQLEQWHHCICEVEASMRKLGAELETLREPREPIYTVYEDEIRSVLYPKGKAVGVDMQEPIPGLWFRNMILPEFTFYTAPFWVEQLLQREPWGELQGRMPQHVLIIGENRSIDFFLRKQVSRLKSINWLLPERECNESFEQYLEDFYEEFGLVIGYRTYSNEIMLRRERITCPETIAGPEVKVCPECVWVFDYSGGDNMPMVKLPKGSLWLDMYSSEGKQRKVESGYPEITYISLKAKWKQAQKSRNMPFILDINRGNGYNTWESEGMVEPN